MGTFEPCVMYFGQTNAPATFVKNMDHILRTLKSKYPNNIFIYMDDILIATSEAECTLHWTIVHSLLDILECESFFLKPWKCVFETNKVSYLGTILDGATFMQDLVKVEGIVNWPRHLKSQKEVQQILGILNYQRAFVPGYADLAQPLNSLLKKDLPFEWTSDCQHTLDQLINKVVANARLAQPDPSKP